MKSVKSFILCIEQMLYDKFTIIYKIDLLYKIDTICMSPENRKTSNPHELVLNLSGKINLKMSEKNVALSNLRICYTWKNITEITI